MFKTPYPMAWQEPEDANKSKPVKRDNQGLPDLEQWLKNVWKKFGNNPSTQQPSKNAWVAYLVLAAILYGISGVFIVQQAERAVITRFGQYRTIMEPGPHWIPKFIDSKYLVNVGNVTSIRHSGQMLTNDENIVSVEIVVQFEISDPVQYLFKDLEPLNSLRQATEAALRQVIGHSTLDEVLTNGRTKIAASIKSKLQDIIDNYETGIRISDVAMQPAKAPDEVKIAFDDVIKAREEEISSINRAEAEVNEIMPKAEGQAQRIIEEAEAYKQSVLLDAKGQIAHFNLLLPEYLKAPEIMRKRMYIETLESVYANTPKVMIDSNNKSPLVHLPIDQLIKLNQNNKSSES